MFIVVDKNRNGPYYKTLKYCNANLLWEKDIESADYVVCISRSELAHVKNKFPGLIPIVATWDWIKHCLFHQEIVDRNLVPEFTDIFSDEI